MTDFASIRRTRPERTVELCLDAALAAEHEALDQQLRELPDDPNAGMEDGGARVALAEQIRALEGRMREATYPFKVRALKRADYRALKDQCPPRRDETGEVDARDERRGFNIDRLYDLLIPASIIDPALPEPQLREALDDLTTGQYIELGNAAFAVNEGVLEGVPFSRAASAILRSSGTA